MPSQPPADKISRLETEANIWFGCVRPDGRPHLTPVWFVWHDGKIYIGIDPNGVKMRNLLHSPKVTLALEDGTHPLICEGEAELIHPPFQDGMVGAFLAKYDWNIPDEKQFHQVVEVTPIKWLSW
jgi:hypothetical protein